MRKLLLALLVSVGMQASSLTETFPAYAYVLSEFDIDTGYIFDDDFERYASVHEKRMR